MNELNIGPKIRSRRKQLKLTQEELAERSNLSITFISQIETEQRDNITVRRLNDIALALDLSLTELINFKLDGMTQIKHEMSNYQTDYLPQTVQLVNKLLQMDGKRAEEISAAILKLIR